MAYSPQKDRDSVDAVARYFWNMALASALLPSIHILEVCVRNALFDVGVKQTRGRTLIFRSVRCWLDAGLLEQRERDEVEKVTRRLTPGRQTPGHLIGELSFGFWIRLCDSPYEQGLRSSVPLWPEAGKRFHYCPRPVRDRKNIRARLAHLADFRNRVAHHHPIWDRRPDKRHKEIIETIGWMNPNLAAGVRETSNVQTLYDAGHAAFRDMAAAVASVFV